MVWYFPWDISLSLGVHSTWDIHAFLWEVNFPWDIHVLSWDNPFPWDIHLLLGFNFPWDIHAWHGMFPSLQTFTFIWGVPFPWDIWFPPRSCFPLDSGELLSLRLQGVAFPWDRSSLGRFISPETLTDSVSHEVHNIHFPAVGMVMVWLSLVTSTKQQLSTKMQDNAALVPLILSQLSLGPKIKGLNC